ncbi:hypothetical protein Salat_1674800 [Sesamum alatum]|uniref:RNase H type-1 domain-containing protein n=1 Tax=Sesamum alatum TaxID=300844 RepID=A0AAE1Y7J7_9LAMI|nr:hypothetical protein Salat_1674800 [Sesamum alatum]
MGDCVAWSSIRVPHVRQAELAEPLTARVALETCLKFGCTGVILEGDCFNVMKNLSSNDFGCSPLSPILSDIKHLASLYNVSSFSHVKGVANSVAHALAKRATGCEEGVYPPYPVVNIIMVEALRQVQHYPVLPYK